MTKLIFAVFAMSGLAAAQSTDWKGWEVYGHAGVGKAYDDEGNIGYGAAGGLGVGKRVSRRWAIEGEWTRFTHDREFVPGFGTKGHGDFFMANGVLHFAPDKRVQPFVLFGGGVLKYETHDAGFAWNVGVGLKAYLTDHWFIRPEFRVQHGKGTRNGGPEPPISQGRFQLGVGYRW